jgi:hypothetical protein
LSTVLVNGLRGTTGTPPPVNPAKDPDALLARGKDLFPSMKSGRQLVEQRWIQDNDYYDSKFSTDDPSQSEVLGKSRIFVPKTRSRVQLLLAEVLDTLLFDPEEICDVQEWGDIPQEVRQLVKSRLNWRLNGNPIDFWQEAYEAAEDGLVRRCAIMKVYPRLKLDRNSRTEFRDACAPDGSRVLAYEPQIETLRYEDAFFHKNATWKDYWRYPMVHRVERTRDYLRRYGYKNVDLVVPQGTGQEGSDQVKAQRGLTTGSPFAAQAAQIPKEDKIYVYEFWDFLDLGKGYLQSCYYSLLGNADGPQALGRDVAANTLPFKFSEFEEPRAPIVFGVVYPRAHELYGSSFPGDHRQLQQEVNYFRHQEREAVALAVRRPLLVQREAAIDTSALLNRRSSSVVMGDEIGEDAIRELQTGTGAFMGNVYGVRTEQDFSESSSLAPSSLGVQDRGRDVTATEVSDVRTNAGKRVKMAIRCLARTCFVPAFRMLLRLEQAYVPNAELKKAYKRHLGKELEEDDDAKARDTFPSDVGLRVDVANNKGSQFQQWKLLLDAAVQSNMALANIVQLQVANPAEVKFQDPSFYLRQLLRALGHHNTEETEIQAQPPANPGATGRGMASPPAPAVLPGGPGGAL